jgi:hypothetical protein
MTAKKLLYPVLVAAIVVLAVAVPVFAEDDIPMWVQRARLAWCGRSSGGPDRVVGMIHIFDANREMVDGALVEVVWTLPNAGELVTTTVTSDPQGIAEFSLWDGRGDYEICVLNVAKEGWTYDYDQNREECATISVW